MMGLPSSTPVSDYENISTTAITENNLIYSCNFVVFHCRGIPGMSYFVTGTDTGVGKTLVSCALLHAFAAQGKLVVGMKPVVCGCNERGRYEDVEKLIAAGNVGADHEQVNPYCFTMPLAPHIAARNAGRRIEFTTILSACRYLEAQADVVIVEGVGGYRTPLNDRQDGADMAARLELPVIMVVGMRLGCLNHSLLTAAAIKASGLQQAGWVANVPDPGMAALRENILTLQQRLDAPLLGVTGFQQQPDARIAAAQLNIGLLNRPETNNA
jgi:dethiobiotin synthetase